MSYCPKHIIDQQAGQSWISKLKLNSGLRARVHKNEDGLEICGMHFAEQSLKYLGNREGTAYFVFVSPTFGSFTGGWGYSITVPFHTTDAHVFQLESKQESFAIDDKLFLQLTPIGIVEKEKMVFAMGQDQFIVQDPHGRYQIIYPYKRNCFIDPEKKGTETYEKNLKIFLSSEQIAQNIYKVDDNYYYAEESAELVYSMFPHVMPLPFTIEAIDPDNFELRGSYEGHMFTIKLREHRNPEVQIL